MQHSFISNMPRLVDPELMQALIQQEIAIKAFNTKQRANQDFFNDLVKRAEFTELAHLIQHEFVVLNQLTEQQTIIEESEKQQREIRWQELNADLHQSILRAQSAQMTTGKVVPLSYDLIKSIDAQLRFIHDKKKEIADWMESQWGGESWEKGIGKHVAKAIEKIDEKTLNYLGYEAIGFNETEKELLKGRLVEHKAELQHVLSRPPADHPDAINKIGVNTAIKFIGYLNNCHSAFEAVNLGRSADQALSFLKLSVKSRVQFINQTCADQVADFKNMVTGFVSRKEALQELNKQENYLEVSKVSLMSKCRLPTAQASAYDLAIKLPDLGSKLDCDAGTSFAIDNGAWLQYLCRKMQAEHHDHFFSLKDEKDSIKFYLKNKEQCVFDKISGEFKVFAANEEAIDKIVEICKKCNPKAELIMRHIEEIPKNNEESELKSQFNEELSVFRRKL